MSIYMLKWILRFFYVVIMMIAAMFVYASSNFERVEKYYEDIMRDNINQEEDYFIGINTVNGLDYVQKNAGYSFVSTHDTHKITVSLHAIGATIDGKKIDGVMVFFNAYEIYENNVLLEEIVFEIKADLSEKTYKGANSELTDQATTYFTTTGKLRNTWLPVLFLLYTDNFLAIPNSTNFAIIEGIQINYSNGEKNDDGQLIFQPLYSGHSSPSSLAFNQDENFSYDADTYQLSKVIGDELSDDEIASLGLITERASLRPYTGIVIRNMAIFFVIFSALTYVLFFHKRVMEMRRAKQNPPITTGKTPVVKEAIFKDVVPKDES